MTLRTEVRIVIATLLAVQVLTAFGAIAVLDRMAPAIDEIIRENVVSLEAKERMLVAVALSSARPDDPELARQFTENLERARRNVTEDAERPTLAELDRLAPRAVSGDARVAAELTRQLSALGAVNREAMRTADARARALGTAGAWAVVVLAGLALGLSTVVARRLEARLLGPLEAIRGTIEGYAAGDPHRRCHAPLASPELGAAIAAVNQLLDRSDRREPPADQRSRARDRVLLVRLLDEQPDPVAFVREDGSVIAASRALLDALADDTREDELRAALAAAPRGDASPLVADVAALPDVDAWRVRLSL